MTRVLTKDGWIEVPTASETSGFNDYLSRAQTGRLSHAEELPLRESMSKIVPEQATAPDQYQNMIDAENARRRGFFRPNTITVAGQEHNPNPAVLAAPQAPTESPMVGAPPLVDLQGPVPGSPTGDEILDMNRSQDAFRERTIADRVANLAPRPGQGGGPRVEIPPEKMAELEQFYQQRAANASTPEEASRLMEQAQRFRARMNSINRFDESPLAGAMEGAGPNPSQENVIRAGMGTRFDELDESRKQATLDRVDRFGAGLESVMRQAESIEGARRAKEITEEMFQKHAPPGWTREKFDREVLKGEKAAEKKEARRRELDRFNETNRVALEMQKLKNEGGTATAIAAGTMANIGTSIHENAETKRTLEVLKAGKVDQRIRKYAIDMASTTGFGKDEVSKFGHVLSYFGILHANGTPEQKATIAGWAREYTLKMEQIEDDVKDPKERFQQQRSYHRRIATTVEDATGDPDTFTSLLKYSKAYKEQGE